MAIGISKELLQEMHSLAIILGNRIRAQVLSDLIKGCEDLEPWLPIETSIVDNKEYLFVTKSKRQRVDRFHPSQHTTVNTDLRWQERPGDRYTHYKELPEVPKMKELQSEIK